MNGKRVYSMHLDLSGGVTNVRLDLGNLPAGLYLLRLTTGMASYTDRIIFR